AYIRPCVIIHSVRSSPTARTTRSNASAAASASRLRPWTVNSWNRNAKILSGPQGRTGTGSLTSGASTPIAPPRRANRERRQGGSRLEGNGSAGAARVQARRAVGVVDQAHGVYRVRGR